MSCRFPRLIKKRKAAQCAPPFFFKYTRCSFVCFLAVKHFVPQWEILCFSARNILFLNVKFFVSRREIKCFLLWNHLFRSMELAVSHREKTRVFVLLFCKAKLVSKEMHFLAIQLVAFFRMEGVRGLPCRRGRPQRSAGAGEGFPLLKISAQNPLVHRRFLTSFLTVKKVSTFELSKMPFRSETRNGSRWTRISVKRNSRN